jgi:hypothetical protein
MNMPSKTTPFALRLTPSSLARLKAVAEAHERSAAWWAAQLIDEGLDRPETPPAPPVAARPREKRLGKPRMADLVYSAFEDALDEHGIDLPDGRRTAAADKVFATFEAKRPEFNKQLNPDAFHLGSQTRGDLPRHGHGVAAAPMIRPTQANVVRHVIYRERGDFPGRKVEEGVPTSFSDRYAFVRSDGRSSAATDSKTWSGRTVGQKTPAPWG